MEALSKLLFEKGCHKGLFVFGLLRTLSEVLFERGCHKGIFVWDYGDLIEGFIEASL